MWHIVLLQSKECSVVGSSERNPAGVMDAFRGQSVIIIS
jgi:hypothetical protein